MICCGPQPAARTGSPKSRCSNSPRTSTSPSTRALFLLSSVSGDDREPWEFERLRELHELVESRLTNADLTGLEARNLVGRRRAEAARLVGGVPRVVERIEGAPRAYVLREDSEAIARHAQLLELLPSPSEARVHVTGGEWIDVAARDKPGLLASVTGVLADRGLDVQEAIVATWSDGAALESFLAFVRAAR